MNLKKMREEIAKRLTKISALEEEIATLEQAIMQEHGANLQNLLAESGRGYGTLTTEVDGVKLTYEVKATYLWDQGKLQALYESLPLADARELVTTKMSVSSKTIERIGNEDVLKRVMEARTTKFSEPRITFIK
jgi:DNA gyrase/topoisomerase IV subunit A